MENSEKWIPIDLMDLIPKKDRPRVPKVQLWEVNPLGQFRYIDTIKGEYRYPKPVIINGQKYFVAVVGWTQGAMIVKKWPVEDLIKRYFG